MTRAISAALLGLSLLEAGSDALTEGVRAFHEGRYAAAKTQLEQWTSGHPEDARGRTFLALVRAATGGCRDAMPELLAQFRTNSDAELRRFSGLALVECATGELARNFPGDPDALYQAARRHKKAWNDAVYELYRRAPASYRVNQLSGEVLETLDKLPEAALEYRKAIAKNPAALDLHFRLGRVLLLQARTPQQLAEARREFETELALNQEDAASELQIAQILTAENDRAAALQHYERALALRPEFPEALLAVARARMESKRYNEAVALLEKGIALQPSNEAAHYTLMLAYRNSGQTERAQAEERRLKELQKPPETEFSDFLKKLGEKPAHP